MANGRWTLVQNLLKAAKNFAEPLSRASVISLDVNCHNKLMTNVTMGWGAAR